ncbi:MAG: recombinase family protein [Steroidobacteraceae bacterium]|nr:recombinase family protein [Steroidobacteraceae bacterium]
MIADGLDRAFDLLLVLELSRLARSEDLPLLIRRLKHRDVRIVGIQDGFDSSARTARMQAGMAAIMGGEYIEMISRRTYSALEMRAREKRATGGRTYGYDSERRPDPDEAAIVREIFARFAAGESMRAIAADLNMRGVPSPGAAWDRKARRRDGRWLVSGLHTILHNELYIGRVVWNRRQWVKDRDTGRRIPRERPREQWIVHEDASLALVERDVWDRCQARLGRPGGGRIGPVRYLLSGLLECGICGSKMTIYGGSTRRYGCATYRGGGVHACANNLSVRQDLAEELILEPIVEDLLAPEAVEEMVAYMRAELRREQIRPAAAVPDVERIDEQIRSLERLLQLGAVAKAAIEQAERERREV